MGGQGPGLHLAEDVTEIPYQVAKTEVILEMHLSYRAEAEAEAEAKFLKGLEVLKS